MKDGRTIKLTPEEIKDLKSRIYTCDTMTQAAIELKIGREVLIQTLDRKSCSPTTYKKLFKQQTA